MVASANVKATYTLKYYTGAAWVDITAECMRNPFIATWGMVDNNPLTFMADTGGMTFTLNNVAGHYSPETATVSTGWAKGTPIQLILTYDTIPYVRFRGRVDTLVFHHEINDVKSVDVNCLDWLDFAAKYPLTNPQVANYITGDVAINTIIAAMPIKPVTQALDVGAYSYPSLLDAVSVRTTAYEEFNKLALSEMSYCYLRHDKVNGEMFVFENNIHRPGTAPLSVVPKMIAASGFILKASSATDYILKAGISNAILNPGFETAGGGGADIFASWDESAGTGTITNEGAVVHSGAHALKFTAGASWWTTLVVQYSITVVPLSKYRIKFWTRGDGTHAGNWYIARTSDSSYIIPIAETGVPGAVYTQVITDFTVPAGCVSIYIVFLATVTNGGICYFDDVELFCVDKLIPDLVDLASFTDNALSIESNYGENITNRFVINTYPKTIDTGAVILYNLGKAIKIASGATKTVTGKYRNPIGGKEISGINMIAPVATTDYLMNTKADGSGTDTTADLVVVCTYDSSKPTYALTNNNAAVGWVTYLKARGYGIYQDDTLTVTLENATSQTAYGVNDLTLEQTYQQDTDLGTLIGGEVLEYNKTPHTKINSITFNANLSMFTMQAFLNIDVGSLVQIIDTPYAISDWFYVHGVSFSLEIGGQLNATWIVKKAASIASGGLTPIGVTFNHANSDALDYGSLTAVTLLKKISISVWMNATGAEPSTYIFSSYDANSGFYVVYSRFGGAHNDVLIYSNCFSSPSQYNTHNVVPDATLFHCIITYDLSALSPAIIYIDGASVAVDTISTPSGNFTPPAVSNFVIGSNFSPAGIYPGTFNGLIKDMRIYNRILTATEVTAIYNGGTPSATAGTTQGMIFQGPCVRTGELTRYVGATLTADLPVLDNVNGYVGTINGSPTGAAF